MKRFNFINNLMKEHPNGEFLDLTNCMICSQDNMYLGDDMDNLNKQIQQKSLNDGPFSVMIIFKEKKYK